MTAQPVDVEIDTLSPKQFAQVVHDASDDVVRATFRAVGTARALDRIFAIMQERYIAQSPGTAATVQWHIDDEGDQHDYVVEIDGATCRTRSGRADRASTTLTTDLARFARLAAGQANGVKLLMTRKLRASGDVNFARKLQAMFDIPTA